MFGRMRQRMIGIGSMICSHGMCECPRCNGSWAGTKNEELEVLEGYKDELKKGLENVEKHIKQLKVKK